ncbi:MAG: hypothetical protein IPN19_06870 [Elusimicrobia bacterium]|nr:hypothetical protein [Elusimicrobiota bacterium]
MAIEFHKIWIEQCEAAQGIKERHGVQKALGYLIGEKLLQFVQTANDHPEFAKELPRFVAEVRRMFHPSLLRDYLQNAERLGVFGYACSEEDHELRKKEEVPVWFHLVSNISMRIRTWCGAGGC